MTAGEYGTKTIMRKPRERWKDVPGWDGIYAVSDLGRVKSMARVVIKRCGRRQQVGESILKSFPNEGGYLRVILRGAGRRMNYPVHRLVLLAFVGACPEGMETCHRNGSRQDNRMGNLAWGTSEDQLAHKREHGTGSKLGHEDVIEIYRRVWAGESSASVARDFGVVPSTANKIKHGNRWAWLTRP